MKNVSVVVLVLVLEALLGGARAACRNDNPSPKMTVNTNIKLWTVNGITYCQTYEKDVIIQCSSDNTENLEILENGKSVQITEVNKTAIQLQVRKPMGRYVYTCVDSGTRSRNCLIVKVEPAMSVESPRVHTKLDRYNSMEYFVPVGEDYLIFCSGPDARDLSIEDKKHVPLQTYELNRTTIQYRAQADRVEEKIDYWCYSSDLRRKIPDSYVMVATDYYPEGHNFGCVLYDYRKLQCAWSYSNDRSEYNVKLFYIDHTSGYEKTYLLCSNNPGVVSLTTCKVNEAQLESSLFYFNHNISLLLITCNAYLCNNQTFAFNTETIRKQMPVEHLKVLDTSSRSVILSWNDYCYTCVYKVERRMAGDIWRKETASTAHCHWDRLMICNFTLALSYPDTEYEVRVSARSKGATHEDSWSDSRSILVHTKPRKQCACDMASAGTISTQSASCELCTLADDIVKVGSAVNKIKSGWKRKLAKIELLAKLRSLD